MENALYGIANYKILETGDIGNGQYTNTESLGESGYITATETVNKISISGSIDGSYKTNFEHKEGCDLVVSANEDGFTFVWSIGEKQIYHGIGMRINNGYVSVAYTYV